MKKNVTSLSLPIADNGQVSKYVSNSIMNISNVPVYMTKDEHTHCLNALYCFASCLYGKAQIPLRQLLAKLTRGPMKMTDANHETGMLGGVSGFQTMSTCRDGCADKPAGKLR